MLPLLPGAGGSLVLVTSRRHLSALDGATAVSLDTLPPGQAAALLVRLAGRAGLSADDASVAELTRLCGFLPLAIGMVARLLHHHPACGSDRGPSAAVPAAGPASRHRYRRPRRATGTGQHARVIALTAALAALLRSDGPWAEAITLHEAAVQAARSLSVTTAMHQPVVTHRDTRRDEEETARRTAFPQMTGRFRWWWQVMGSNHRRLSRRFYRPFLPAPPHGH